MPRSFFISRFLLRRNDSLVRCNRSYFATIFDAFALPSAPIGCYFYRSPARWSAYANQLHLNKDCMQQMCDQMTKFL